MTLPSDNPPSKLILWITTIASFMTAFMGSSINIALPVIGEESNAIMSSVEKKYYGAASSTLASMRMHSQPACKLLLCFSILSDPINPLIYKFVKGKLI
ncbi:MAG: hypothetical protein RBR74_08180 [Ignavibacteriaceae bacterium]|jgi:hypothetical protein|nr:hypothetical protein [Ignavibacteriaceae bacterium]